MPLLNHSEINTMSQFDIDEEYGVPHFWDGIAKWMHQHLGTPWLSGQDMVNAGVRYACMEAGQHYYEIDSRFIPYRCQDGVEVREWGSVRDRKVAVVDDEVVGADVIVGRICIPGEFQRMVKVMSTECVDYFIFFPRLSNSEIAANKGEVA